MTIRVRCDGCSAVMKVKDELAGAKGKCPKCKTPFVVPAAKGDAEESTASDNDQASAAKRSKKPTDIPSATKTTTVASATAATKSSATVASSSAVASSATEAHSVAASRDKATPTEAPIDLPLEATPAVPVMDTEDFDPMAALAAGSKTSIPAMASIPASEPVNKPSVADLMKEHNEKKGRKKSKADKPKTSKAAELAQPAMTSGSAADALNRKYDQKRDESGGSEKLLTREERRQAEQKEAMIEFAKKGVPALAGVLLLSWGLMTYMFSASLPPLGYASGQVSRDGSPLSGVQVVFAPKSPPGQDSPSNATVSQGWTDASGNYTLMYNTENEGVLPGSHEVSIISSSGMTFTLSTEVKMQTVNVGETHTFDFNL